MSKYDCNKTLNCMHELDRVCSRYESCDEGCPLFGRNCSPKAMTQTEIDILQRWSDENPEAPKLTKKDRMFLESFAIGINRRILKDVDNNVFYHFDGTYSKLSDDMFKALEPNTRMTFDELLNLEVEE